MTFTVITFDTTHAAMAATKALQAADVPCHVIPVPASIHAGCGMAAKIPSDRRDEVCALAAASAWGEVAKAYEQVSPDEYKPLPPMVPPTGA